MKLRKCFIKVKNQTEFETCLLILLVLGYKWNDGQKVVFSTNYSLKRYKHLNHICINSRSKLYLNNREFGQLYQEINYEDILKM